MLHLRIGHENVVACSRSSHWTNIATLDDKHVSLKFCSEHIIGQNSTKRMGF